MEMEEIRPLTDAERALARWMLVNGTEEAANCLEQLDLADATSWKCPCGCASYKFRIKGRPSPPPGTDVLGDFLVGDGEHRFGIFIYSAGGILSGVEVYGLAGDAPQILPSPEVLHRYEDSRP